MKKHLRTLTLVTCLTLVSAGTFGQKAQKLENVSDNRIVSILNDLSILAERRTDELSIRLFNVSNGSGSAGLANCEVTNNIYIAVSEFDEAPEQSLHTYGPVYDPKVLGWTGQSSEQILTIEFGQESSRRQVKLKISIGKVTVMK